VRLSLRRRAICREESRDRKSHHALDLPLARLADEVEHHRFENHRRTRFHKLCGGDFTILDDEDAGLDLRRKYRPQAARSLSPVRSHRTCGRVRASAQRSQSRYGSPRPFPAGTKTARKPLAAKVAGYVASVPVTDNTYVHTGDVIATLDDGDYRLTVDSAREKAATQAATVARMAHQIVAQEAAVEQAKTQLASAKGPAKRTELELDRQNLLIARDASSRQLQEQAQANRDQAVPGVEGAQAAIDSAAANVDVPKGQQQEAISTLDELKTALAKVERDLSFTPPSRASSAAAWCRRFLPRPIPFFRADCSRSSRR
jgi:Biotin-lipoyl like